MKILISPDKFKGSLTARQVCEAIRAGIHRFDPNIQTVCHPLADGGEGTLDVLEDGLDLETVRLTVNDPVFRQVEAFYKKSEDTAFIEMATASGLELLSEHERNCLHTSTFGTGQLIHDALQRGVKKIYLFIGGSATSDGGIGMAAALGYRFLDEAGKSLHPAGESLRALKKIEKPDDEQTRQALQSVEFHVVCDVKNPLFGEQGAAHVYAPQKGADENAVEILDEGLRNLAKLVKEDLGKDIAEMPGTGAAGGLGGGAVAFLDADILPGIDTVIQVTGFQNQLEGTDLIITGEGKLDQQTLAGKVIAGVAEAGQESGIPVAVICGAQELEQKELEKIGVWHSSAVLQPGVPVDEAIVNASQYVAERSFELVGKFAEKSGK